MSITTTIHLKVGKDVNDTFNRKAGELNRKPSDLMRDLMVAFNEDRLTITPTEEQQRLFGIPSTEKE